MANKNGVQEGEIVEEKNDEKRARKKKNSGMVWGLILVVAGGILFAEEVLNIEVWDNFWPLILVFIGLFMIIQSVRK